MESFNNAAIGRLLLKRIEDTAKSLRPLCFMEVCGTHTMAIGRTGIRKLLPANIRLVSGPGCPVCVTPAGVIDNAARLGLEKRVVLATFGDMVRVPGAATSLENARAQGADVRVITSPAEIQDYPGETVFLAVGFETTTAPIAAVVDTLVRGKRRNISLYTSLKVVPPALRLLRHMKGMAVDGFLLPGHVSAVIGADAYGRLGLPSVIAGFEMVDMLQAILSLIESIRTGDAGVKNEYTRVVKAEGNAKARTLVEKYFEPCDQVWRGLGVLPGCSLRLKAEYGWLDAEIKYGLKTLSDKMPEGCSCGEVLKGAITPDKCPQFAKACMPESPLGPCMVSSEGSCAAFYKYEREI